MKTKEKRLAIKKIVQPLMQQGKTLTELCDAVNAQGIKTERGAEYSQSTLYSMIMYHRWGRPSGMRMPRNAKNKIAYVKTETDDHVALRSLILHSQRLADETKIKLLKDLE